jgi:hypothetical protein
MWGFFFSERKDKARTGTSGCSQLWDGTLGAQRSESRGQRQGW